MAADRLPGTRPDPTFACFRPDRRTGAAPDGGHGLWLVDTPATLASVLGADPLGPLPAEARGPAGAALAADPPVAQTGLQRIDWTAADGRLGSLTFAVGLGAADRRALLRAFDAPTASASPASASPASASPASASPASASPAGGQTAAADPARRIRSAPGVAVPAGPILVIGAGLAGSAVAAALARRGRSVRLVEQRGQPGGAVADVPLLAQNPALSADDNARSRLSRAALAIGWRQRAFLGDALAWCGRHQPVDGDPARLLRGWPATLARLEAAATANEPALIEFPRCALARTSALLGRLATSARIEVSYHHEVVAIERRDDRWWARIGAGSPTWLGPFAAVIVACPDHERLTGLVPPWTPAGRRTPGRVLIEVAAGDMAETGPGAACRIDGALRGGDDAFRLRAGRWRVTGADGDLGQARDQTVDPGGHDAARQALDPVTAAASPIARRLSAPGSRFDPIDHLPLIGPVPAQRAVLERAEDHHRNDRLAFPLVPGLALATGFGGRGLLWAALAAEIIAAAIDDEPPVVEASLAAAIDPGRFLRRRLRRSPN